MSIRKSIAVAALLLASHGRALYGQEIILPKPLQTPEVQAALTSAEGRKYLQSGIASMGAETAKFRADPALVEYYARRDAGDDFAAFLAIQGPARSGHAHAESELGWLYIAGIGTSEDIEKGIEWLTRSSEHGDLGATSMLGGIYSSSAYPKLNLPKANKLLEDCAIKRRPSCVGQLALLYTRTDNPKRNMPMAVAWASIALEAQLPGAEVVNDKVKRLASIADVYEAESLKPKIIQRMLESNAREVNPASRRGIAQDSHKRNKK